MAPEFTFNLGFDYDVSLPGGDLTLSGSYNGRDTYWGQAIGKPLTLLKDQILR